MLLPVMKQKMMSAGPGTKLSVFFKKSNGNGSIGNGGGQQANNLLEESVLLALLRTVCDVQRNRTSTARSPSPEENQWFHQNQQNANHNQNSQLVTKNVYYTNCVAALIGFYCSNSSSAPSNQSPKSESNSNDNQIRPLLQYWIDSVRSTLEILEPADRILHFNSILGSINQVTEEVARKRLAVNFVSVLSYSLTHSTSNSSLIIGDLIISISRTVHSTQLIVYLLECFIETYLDLNGDLYFLVSNLNLGGKGGGSPVSSPSSSNSADDQQASNGLIMESLQSQSCLVLLIHIYNRLSKSTVPEQCTRKYVCKLVEQSANFKPPTLTSSTHQHDESRIILYYLKLISLLSSPPGPAGDPLLYRLSQSEHQFFSLVNVSINQTQSLEASGGSAVSSNGGSSSNDRNFASTNFFSSPSSDLFISVQALQALCKGLHHTISESQNRGWLFFRSQQHCSNWYVSGLVFGIFNNIELYLYLGVFS